MPRRSPILLILSLLAALASLRTAHSDPVTWDVHISRSGFAPSDITVTEGDLVRWINDDSVSHTSTSDSLVWDSGPIAPGGSYTLGTDGRGYGLYRYHSQGDSSAFRGSILVQLAVSSPTPTPTGPPGGTPTPTPPGTTPTPPGTTPTPPGATPTPGPPTPSPTPPPTGGGPTPPPPGGDCSPVRGTAIQIGPLYVWTDGLWQETNGWDGLQRMDYRCSDGTLVVHDAQLIGL
jgi:plastocyanin